MMTGRTLLGHTAISSNWTIIISVLFLLCLNVHERFERMYVTWDTSKTRHNEVAPNQFELAPILKKQT
jgi:glutamine synthetase type III